MLEAGLVLVFVTLAIVTIGSRSLTTTGMATDRSVSFVGDGSDLPCPWCRAQTSDSDDHCPSCGHRFG